MKPQVRWDVTVCGGRGVPEFKWHVVGVGFVCVQGMLPKIRWLHLFVQCIVNEL